jgi:iron complex outermembrane receptor protein
MPMRHPMEPSVGAVGRAASLAVAIALATPDGAHAASDVAVADGGLEEVIVTARRREERLQDVPDTITAFTAVQIERAGIDELVDYVQLTPGLSLVEASQSPGIALINIRGIGQQYQSEAPVAVVIDGVQTTSVSAINQALPDIERIEVLKGPQGALYGRNAIGGAINITTRAPTDDFAGQVKLGYANGDEPKAEAYLSGPIVPGRARFRIAGYYRDYEGDFRNDVTGEYTNPLEDLALRARAIVDLTDALSLDLRASTGRTENAGYQAAVLPGGDAGDFSQRPRSGRAGSGERTFEEYSLRLDWTTSIGVLAATTGYTTSDDESSYDLDQQPIEFLDLDRQFTGIEALSQEIRLTSPDDRSLRYTVGAYYLGTDRDRETAVNVIPFGLLLPGDVHDDNEAWALFAQLNYDLTEVLEITLAARYDEDSREQTDELSAPGSADHVVTETFDQLQPKVSLAYAITPDVNLYATYAQGFRSGGFNTPGPVFARIYDSEQTTNYEFGIKTTLAGGRVRLNAAAYVTEYDDQQIQLLDLGTGQQGIVNIDETRNAGFELDASAALGEAVTLTAGVGYLDSEIREFTRQPEVVGNRSPYSPEWTYSLALDYETDLGQWQGAFRVAATGQAGMAYEYFSRERNGDPPFNYALSEQPSYVLVDLRATMSHDALSLTLYSNNVFDEKYHSDAVSSIITGGLGELGIRGRARRYGVEVGYRF